MSVLRKHSKARIQTGRTRRSTATGQFVFGRARRRAKLRSRDAIEIIKRISMWSESEAQAYRWYRSFPIAELGNVTARALVETGRSDQVHRYLDHIAEGGYA